jgi:polysaccharide biosynthesis protein PslH
MNVIWLTYGLPSLTSGAALRDLHLLAHVRRRHRVHLLTVLEHPPAAGARADMASLCDGWDWVAMRQERGWRRWRAWGEHWAHAHPIATWAYCPRAMEDKLRALVHREAVDLVQIEHSFLAPYARALERARCRVVLDFHNYGQAQYRSMLGMQMGHAERLAWLAKAWSMRGWEAGFAARADRCFAVSPTEARALSEVAGRPVELLPNGVDTTTLRPLPPTPGHRLLFVGNLRYPPNRDAVTWLAREILPLVRRQIADVHLTVVGDDDGRAAVVAPGVTCVGQVDDVKPHYQRAQVVVAPLRAGGGTRIKILEAMALGRPVVSTGLGCAGLSVTSGHDILIGETPAALADAIVRLLSDANIGARIADRARALVERDYDWGDIGQRLIAAYDRLVPPTATHVSQPEVP